MCVKWQVASLEAWSGTEVLRMTCLDCSLEIATAGEGVLAVEGQDDI